MTDLNEKALEAAARQLMPFGVDVPLDDRDQVIAETWIDAEVVITAYFDSLAEQGIAVMEVRTIRERMEVLALTTDAKVSWESIFKQLRRELDQ